MEPIAPHSECPYVSRGGLKLAHAIAAFAVDVKGLSCADFGCSTGGFTDCLLQHGASRVCAIDTAYGQLAWKLRNDARVTVMERTNALHAALPGDAVDLVVADAGWTPQRLLLPAAARWLRMGGMMISLVKPHYELKDRGQALPRGGVLDDATAEQIARTTVEAMAGSGFDVRGLVKSPIRGGQKRSKDKTKGSGNSEWLALAVKAT